MNPLRALGKQLIPSGLRHWLKYHLVPPYRDQSDWAEDRRRGQLVFDATNGLVVGGPFAGLKYVSSAKGSSIGPKLLGTYEMELNPAITEIFNRQYPLIINIGAGEGYYAVGLAQKSTASRIICFDSDASNQDQTRTLAQLNNVADRIDVRGHCEPASLQEVLSCSDKSLVVCDIEGYEVELLDPQKVPALLQADMLVELHDIIRKGCSAILRNRFENTHEIKVFSSRPRTMNDFPPAINLPAQERLGAMDEGRGASMDFFWMKRKST